MSVLVLVVQPVARGRVYAKFVDVIKQKGLDVAIEKIDDDDEPVKRTGCCGLCSLGPLVKVMPSGITYSHVTVDDVEEIVEKHLSTENQ